jgi:uncharacterized zinc-type alcohol dehydrogenase-like protein
LVPGHEAIGKIVATGSAVRLEIGQTVGVGWNSSSCGTCEDCLGGDDNMCPDVQGVIVGRHGGFADRLRVSQRFAIPVPEALDPAAAGPLLCGGVTVYNPLKQFAVKPQERVGVVGIGGLGHMALQFANAWGCEVTAFSTSPDKEEEARRMGAHRFVGSRDSAALEQLPRSLDVLLVTVNVPLDWPGYIETLRPRGRLVILGAVLEPMALPAFPLILGQRSVAGSPNGSARTTAEMLQFAARHGIQPLTQEFPLGQVNEAMDILRQNRARYRLVLKMPE